MTLRSQWGKTRSQQSMLQEISEPLGIFEIRLTARDGFDVLGTEGQELELPF